jgi:hypothetical protein
MENEQDVTPTLWTGWISMILGIWLFVSPWALRYAYHGASFWNNLLLGILVLIVGIVIGSTGSSAPSRWNTFFGLWLIISPFLLRYSRLEAVMVNDIVVGILVLLVSLIRPTPSRRPVVT